MNKAFSLAIVALTVTSSFAVKAQTSDKILTELSNKAKNYTTVYVEYSSQLIDKVNAVDVKQSGKVYVKGEKYYVELGDYTMISDGQSVWTYEKAANDCYIDYLEDVADGALSPSKMFTIWEEGFKHEFKSEVKEGAQTLFWINLYPTNPSEKNYHTIQLYVDKAKMEVVKFIVKGREGSDIVYKLDKFTPNQAITDAQFKFDSKKFPGVNIIDNRI
ncbi:MAG: outer membrane lipoprotein carrier protein LolA [Flavobacteriales bacterium]